MDGSSNFSLVVQTSLILFSFVVGMLADLIQSKIVEKLEEFELQHISRRNLLKYFIIHPGGEEVGKTRSGTEKRCSHNLQSGHLVWWSADNCSVFPKVNILEVRSEPTEEISQ